MFEPEMLGEGGRCRVGVKGDRCGVGGKSGSCGVGEKSDRRRVCVSDRLLDDLSAGSLVRAKLRRMSTMMISDRGTALVRFVRLPSQEVVRVAA
jgi:hypothetical protein